MKQVDSSYTDLQAKLEANCFNNLFNIGWVDKPFVEYTHFGCNWALDIT
jgi:hypothetical protein